MREHFVNILLFSFYLYLTGSCKTEDIIPEKMTNEIMISCYLSDFRDTTSSKKVWVGYSLNYYSKNFNFVGHCWNYNTDSMPTVKSEIRKEVSGTWSWNLITKESFQTGIPVSGNDRKLIVRSFLIFNDTLVRYSDPLVLNNPLGYAK